MNQYTVDFSVWGIAVIIDHSSSYSAAAYFRASADNMAEESNVKAFTNSGVSRIVTDMSESFVSVVSDVFAASSSVSVVE